MKKIFRILNREFQVVVSDHDIDEYDKFMETYGNSLSIEMFSYIHQAMKNSIELEEKITAYKLSVIVEKTHGKFKEAISFE